MTPTLTPILWISSGECQGIYSAEQAVIERHAS